METKCSHCIGGAKVLTGEEISLLQDSVALVHMRIAGPGALGLEACRLLQQRTLGAAVERVQE
jgi:hypothetical protein